TGQLVLVTQPGQHLREILRTTELDTVEQPRLSERIDGDDGAGHAGLTCGQQRGKNPTNPTQSAVQRQLTEQYRPCHPIGGYRPGSRQRGHGDTEVVTSTNLRQVHRRQPQRDVLVGPGAPGVTPGRTDTVLRLPQPVVRQPEQRGSRHPRTDVAFD